MDTLGDELLNFWRILNKNNVRYIMAGGFATRFHGFNRVAELDGLSVPLLYINQLILNKKVVGRPKDQVDIIELEKIKK